MKETETERKVATSLARMIAKTTASVDYDTLDEETQQYWRQHMHQVGLVNLLMTWQAENLELDNAVVDVYTHAWRTVLEHQGKVGYLQGQADFAQEVVDMLETSLKERGLI